MQMRQRQTAWFARRRRVDEAHEPAARRPQALRWSGIVTLAAVVIFVSGLAESWLGHHYREGKLAPATMLLGVAAVLVLMAQANCALGLLAAAIRRRRFVRLETQIARVKKSIDATRLRSNLGLFGEGPFPDRTADERLDYLRGRRSDLEDVLLNYTQPERLAALRVGLARLMAAPCLATVGATPVLLAEGRFVMGSVSAICAFVVCAAIWIVAAVALIATLFDLHRGRRRHCPFRLRGTPLAMPAPARRRPRPLVNGSPSPLLLLLWLALFFGLLYALHLNSTTGVLQRTAILVGVAGGLMGYTRVLASPSIAVVEDAYERAGWLDRQMRAADHLRQLLVTVRGLIRPIPVVSASVWLCLATVTTAVPNRNVSPPSLPLLVFAYSWLAQAVLGAVLAIWARRQEQRMFRSAELHARLLNPRVQGVLLVVTTVCILVGGLAQFTGI